MSTTSTWTGKEALPVGGTVLLEASAGTGKTFQMAHLVTRLVAEYTVPIERILIITFTNAAVAELRIRIRKRLLEARDVLSTETEPEDPLWKELWASDPTFENQPSSASEHEKVQVPTAEELRRKCAHRVNAALRDFDLAPISTIHGFCQNMLEQFAFESGQESGLTLQKDTDTLLTQLIDDERARIMTTASAEQQNVIRSFGWKPSAIKFIFKEQTRAVVPVVEPLVTEGVDDLYLPVTLAQQWLDAVHEFQNWLDGNEGRHFIEEWKKEFAKDTKKRRLSTKKDVNLISKVRTWLKTGGLREKRTRPLNNLSLIQLHKSWIEGDPSTFEAYPLYEKFSALVDYQEVIWSKALSALASRARATLDDILAERGLLTYSSILSRLADSIQDQGPNGPLAEGVRARYDAALVDEFQDTDGAQWPILKSVFHHPDKRLLVVGDPKQAIYAFRGADVHVYLEAAEVADQRYTMKRNWRSDGPLVDAMNHLWRQHSHSFDLEAVDYVDVDVPDKHFEAAIRNLPFINGRSRSPLELRWLDDVSLGGDGVVVSQKNKGTLEMVRRASKEVAILLDSEVEIFDSEATPPKWRSICPNDIAILVRSHRQADLLEEQLQNLGVPAVQGGQGNVLDSPTVDWICAWLDAIAEPSREHPARLLATSPLFGWRINQLAAAVYDPENPGNDEAMVLWESWRQAIQKWSSDFHRKGFVRVFEAATDAYQIIPKLLTADNGERLATDLRHLIELVHAEERRTQLGPAGLSSWLQKIRRESGTGDDTRSIRLETDAQAVKLVTIHTSKGLEYPIVLVPFCWQDKKLDASVLPILWHHSDAVIEGESSTLALSLHQKNTVHRSRAVAAHNLERRQEQMRLLYVALTRARHHVVAWLGPIGEDACDLEQYALGRLVFRHRNAEGVPLQSSSFPVFTAAGRLKNPDKIRKVRESNFAVKEMALERLNHLAETSNGSVAWSIEPDFVEMRPITIHRSDPFQEAEWSEWPKYQKLVSPWQVSSYSAMVKGRSFDVSEPQRHADTTLEADPLEPDENESDHLGSVPSLKNFSDRDTRLPSHDLRGGAEVGTWVHEVLEKLDFQSKTGPNNQSFLNLIREKGIRNGVHDEAQHNLLAKVLPDVLDTPLWSEGCGLPKDYTLQTLTNKDRLDELGFDLCLGAGNGWNRKNDSRSINVDAVRCVLEHRAVEDNWGGQSWLRDWLDETASNGTSILPRISGILTGFIDLTFRVGGNRYYIADYKTNRIGPTNRRRDAKLGHYTRPWLEWEMGHHGYHLQSLLYTVALHRLLRQRICDYTYDTHVGGHLYLFLRGMVGSNTARYEGHTLGVYHDRWPAPVVLGLDAALSGKSIDAVQNEVLVAEKGRVV